MMRKLCSWILIVALLAPAFAWAADDDATVEVEKAESVAKVETPDVDVGKIEPAAGKPGDYVLNGARSFPTEGAAVKDEDEDEEGGLDAAVQASVHKVSGEGDILSDRDEEAYRKMLRDARAGREPDLSAVKDRVLVGYAKGAYLLKKDSSFSALNGWLKDYRDLAVASEVYKAADAKRERSRQVCTSKQVEVKAKKGKEKKGKKAIAKTRTVKSCKMVGQLGPAPIKSLWMEMKERKQAEREAAQEERLGKMDPAGRKILAASWRARVRGDFGEALTVLLQDGAREAAGDAGWQSELVKVASFYHGKREWKYVLRAAEPASEAKGPTRDDALWLAGFASYRLGQVRNAADYWDDLAKNEPAGSSHSARASWWAARAYAELGQNSKVKDLLKLGTRDQVGFYGQLCAAKLGQDNGLSWSLPGVSKDDVEKLAKVPAARRALALAQVGETVWAQQEFKMADDDLPYQSTRTLAVLAAKKELPAVALQAAKELQQRGEVLGAALFPLPTQWAPQGGKWQFDKALMFGVMRQESAFQPGIGSWAGAQGLMQIMPATGAFIARLEGRPVPSRADLHDPTTNLTLSQDYFNYLAGKLEGNLMLVVAAYNGGMGNVQRWLDRGVTPGGDPVLWLESIPFDETRDYVEKVFANYWIYQQRMGMKMWSLQSLAEGYWPLQWKNAQRGGES